MEVPDPWMDDRAVQLGFTYICPNHPIVVLGDLTSMELDAVNTILTDS